VPELPIDNQAKLNALEGCEVATERLYISFGCADLRPLHALRVAEQGLGISAGGGREGPSLVGLEKLERASLELLVVAGSDLRSLESLRSLELGPEGGVLGPGTLSIRGCPELVSLAGLERLVPGAGDLVIEGNPRLETLSPVVFPSTLDQISLYENAALRDISALSGVEQVATFTLRGSAVEALTVPLKRAVELEVVDNPMLVDASGLENLEYVSEMRFARNPALRRTPEFARLSTAGRIVLVDNEQLEAIGGFPLLTELVELDVTSHPELTSIAAWPSLGSVGWFSIARNASLTSLSFDALATIRGRLIIASNPLLPPAAITPFDRFDVPYEKIVANQGDVVAVAEQCPWERDDVCDEDPGGPLCARHSDPDDCDSYVQ
jgi:hypothetical protein